MTVKKKKITDEYRIDNFNEFACTHKFYSQSTGLNDQPYFIDVGGQMTINTKCEARYEQLVDAWRVYNK